MKPVALILALAISLSGCAVVTAKRQVDDIGSNYPTKEPLPKQENK